MKAVCEGYVKVCTDVCVNVCQATCGEGGCMKVCGEM